MDIHLNLQTEPVEQAKAETMLTVQVGTTIRDVLQHMRDRASGSVIVCDGEKMVGIFTERDALKIMANDADLTAPIDTVMISNPVTIHQSDPIAEAIKAMSKGGYRRLPIVDDDDRLVGIVKVSGILHYVVEHFPQTVFNLPPDPNVITAEREGA